MLRLVDELEIPVPAHIVERPDAVFGASNQQHRFVGHCDRGYITDLRQVMGKCNKSPGTGKEVPGFQFKKTSGRVNRSRQPMPDLSLLVKPVKQSLVQFFGHQDAPVFIG